jgi:hypothetical protein
MQRNLPLDVAVIATDGCLGCVAGPCAAKWTCALFLYYQWCGCKRIKARHSEQKDRNHRWHAAEHGRANGSSDGKQSVLHDTPPFDFNSNAAARSAKTIRPRRFSFDADVMAPAWRLTVDKCSRLRSFCNSCLRCSRMSNERLASVRGLIAGFNYPSAIRLGKHPFPDDI